MFDIAITADIKSDEPITMDELNAIITEALNNRQMEGLTIKRDHFFGLTPIQGNLSSNVINQFHNVIHFKTV